MNFKLRIMKMRVTFVSLALLALLLASGGLLPVNAASSASAAPTSTFSNSVQSVAPTTVGTITKMGTSPTLASVVSSQANYTSFSKTPISKVGTRNFESGPNAPAAAFVPPVVSASNIVNNPGKATTAKGVNAFDSGSVNGFDVEPPDQGLCAGNGYVIDVINLVLKVYSASTFAPLSSDVALAALLGFPIGQQFGQSAVGGGYILSDPRCLYDASTGHWFLSFLYLGGPGVYSAGGPFPLPDFAYEFVLASTSTTPLGTWNIYSIDVTDFGGPGQTNDVGCPCFGDQPLLGADQNSLVISTNEYPIFPLGFNGAQVYLFDKQGLASGLLSVNVVHFQTGLIPSPNGACVPTTGLDCWWSVNPASSPTTGSYDTSKKGTEWGISALDFLNNANGFSSGDNRLAIWSFSDTSSLHSASPTVSLSIKVASNVDKYYNPEVDPTTGAASGYLVPQKTGPHPLGIEIFSDNATIGCAAKCHVGKLASNGDGFWDAITYAQGALWAAQPTLVNQGSTKTPNIHLGAVFYVIHASGKSVSLVNEGYVAASNEDLLFPSVGVGPTGNAVITFTLAGTGFYPSTAYGMFGKLSGVGSIFVADAGKSPADGFTEYQDQALGAPLYRPRWGDYSWAVWADGKVFFSTEYIQYRNCLGSVFLTDPSCGGTRDPFANYGTSLNSIAT
ncbi:MAG TPA: hypothetical protein VN739_08065 [Nitrososphaerales archaeon]|nr:hypothetical protein [Nitrososphaerales archaeon]